MPIHAILLRLLPVVLLALPGAALAHAHLTESTPADGAVLSAPPSQIELHYSEAIEPRFSTFSLHRLEAADDDNPRMAPEHRLGDTGADDGNTGITLPVAEELPPGHYALAWEILAADGHTTRGVVRFSLDE